MGHVILVTPFKKIHPRQNYVISLLRYGVLLENCIMDIDDTQQYALRNPLNFTYVAKRHVCFTHIHYYGYGIFSFSPIFPSIPSTLVSLNYVIIYL